MEAAATTQHAHPNTVLHCLYGYYNLGYTRKELARVYNKDIKTIGNWIHVYEATGSFSRARAADKKFTESQRKWLYDYYQQHPLAYLDEARDAFTRTYRASISVASIWRIIHAYGLTWKVLERRAFHIKEKDIFRFVEELSRVNWTHQNIVFIDEVSFDNRGMVRKRGYSIRGKKVAIRGDYQRKARVSILAFAGVNGIIDLYDTDGTFDRVTFVECCRNFAYSKRGNVRQYPGPNSVWILDGAAIHRHPEIVHFIRSIGVVVIFLPAYCPFFNPIEYLFGYIKKSFQRHYSEKSCKMLTPFIAETFSRFENFDMANVFEHCGWSVQGNFDPVRQLTKENRYQMETGEDNTSNSTVEGDNLDFVVRHG